MSTNVSRVRVGAATMLAAVGLSLVAPAAASADPWVPGTGPLHPIRHYAADVLHPFWAVTPPGARSSSLICHRGVAAVSSWETGQIASDGQRT